MRIGIYQVLCIILLLCGLELPIIPMLGGLSGLFKNLGPTSAMAASPTVAPSRMPSVRPTRRPSVSPTVTPTTVAPTVSPTRNPSAAPTLAPTRCPTARPSTTPTAAPTVTPKNFPGYYSVTFYYGGRSCVGTDNSGSMSFPTHTYLVDQNAISTGANAGFTTAYTIQVCVNSSSGQQASYYYDYTNSSSGTVSLLYYFFSTPDCSGPADTGYPTSVSFTAGCSSSSGLYQYSAITKALPTFADGVIVS